MAGGLLRWPIFDIAGKRLCKVNERLLVACEGDLLCFGVDLAISIAERYIIDQLTGYRRKSSQALLSALTKQKMWIIQDSPAQYPFPYRPPPVCP